MSNISNISIETQDGIPLTFTFEERAGNLVLKIANTQLKKAETKLDFFKRDFVTTDSVILQLHNSYLKELDKTNDCETCKMTALKAKYCSILDKLLK